MIEQITIPQIGESISEAQVSRWLVQNNDSVLRDQDIAEIDSDKTTLTIVAPASGKINILVSEGSNVLIGQLIAEIDTSVALQSEHIEKENQKEGKPSVPPVPPKQATTDATQQEPKNESNVDHKIVVTPLARQKMRNEGVQPKDMISHMLNIRIGIKDVENFLSAKTDPDQNTVPSERKVTRKTMSPLRKKLAQRLVKVKNQTAMLTTFNEIDMSRLIKLRNTYKDDFLKKHDTKLGFMAFFVKACSIALKKFPSVNAMIEEEEVLYYDYSDISIAVSTDKGLVVPVIRDTNSLSIPMIEKEIGRLAEKARNFKLLPEDLEGGTFTITNGGVFGSLLSTPIINPPQTAILGMHTIQERPVAVNGQVIIKPMMYIALSYDHRLIDGKESVGFVMEIKRLIENPAFLQFDNPDLFSEMLQL